MAKALLLLEKVLAADDVCADLTQLNYGLTGLEKALAFSCGICGVFKLRLLGQSHNVAKRGPPQLKYMLRSLL